MMIRTLLAAALVAAAAPAFAGEQHDRAATGPLPAHCERQQVHTPAGKLVHNPPIVRCAANAELAEREARPTTPTEPRTAND